MEVVTDNYKLTDVGVIPEDWEVKSLSDLSLKIGSGITPRGGESVYKEQGRPLVRSQNIGWGKLLLENIAYIDDEIHSTFLNTEIKFQDVLLNISGASIGRSSYSNECLVGGNVNQHVCIIRTDKNLLNPIFLNLFLLSKNGQQQIDSFQSGGNRQGLNIGQIRIFQIPLPPTLTEQTAIATALSDTDALISSLEKLIVKKRNIKQGAMQELLRPKEGWEVKKLGDVLKVRHGKDQKQIEAKNGKYLILGTGGIMGFSNTYLYNKESVLIGRKGTIDKPLFMDKPFWTVDTLFYTEINNNNSPKFIFYNFQLIDWYSYNEASGVPSLNARTIENISIHTPKTKTEQEVISKTLTDMDSEITALEAKLSKYKDLKQGMMQNLLTGKIRLV